MKSVFTSNDSKRLNSSVRRTSNSKSKGYLSEISGEKIIPPESFTHGWSAVLGKRAVQENAASDRNTGVSHYSEPLFGVFGFVPNNQNTVLAQFFQALGDLFESIPCSSTFLLLPSEEYKKELEKMFSLS